MVERTADLVELVRSLSEQQEQNVRVVCSAPRGASTFLMKASAVWSQLNAFEELLAKSMHGFVGYHRYLPPTTSLGSLRPFQESDCNKLMEQVIACLSMSAREVQDLQRQLDSTLNPTKNDQFHHLVISGLLQKLQQFSRRWDSVQKMQKRNQHRPSRPFAHYYLSAESSVVNVPKELSTLKIDESTTAAQLLRKSLTSVVPRASASLAERYRDEIAPPAKMKEYERVEAKQKDILLKESASLQKQFSEDMVCSQQIERTVTSLSQMVSEFASLIEAQSATTLLVEESAQDATQSVNSADEELLRTLERSASFRWSTVLLIAVLSTMLVILHVATP